MTPLEVKLYQALMCCVQQIQSDNSTNIDEDGVIQFEDPLVRRTLDVAREAITAYLSQLPPVPSQPQEGDLSDAAYGRILRYLRDQEEDHVGHSA
jgi:hypothetical protein